MRKHCSILGLVALFVIAGTGAAATITVPPNWQPMVMFGLDANWNSPGNPALGGVVQIEGTYYGPASPHTPGAQNLRSAGWPLMNGARFDPNIDSFAPPYAVLNGTSFGRSFGWFADSDLPAGCVWKIVLLGSSPGLRVYDPYDANFSQLFASYDGNAMTYNGNPSNFPGPDSVNGRSEATDQMFHPVFAVPTQTGTVSARFAIYVAGTDGNVLAGVLPAYQTFTFNATPEPASLLLLATGGVLLACRRRRRQRPSPARADG